MTFPKPLIWIILIPSLILACFSSEIVGAHPLGEDATTPEATAITPQATPTQTSVAPTPTPFQPLPPTPTYIPTAFPTPVPTATTAPTPTERSPEEFIASFDGFEHPEEQVNILIMGSDQRVGEIGFRTDTIILLSINTREPSASMISFPRDLYIYVPGWTYQRINTVMYFGGFPLMKETFQYHFGITLDHHIIVGLEAFMETIDSMGGIEVDVGQKLTDHRTGYGNFTVKEGEYLMDGVTALWYARARYTTSDFDRSRRQQEIIAGIANRLLSINGLESADELYDIYHKYVATDLKWLDLAPLVPIAARIGSPSNVEHYFVGRGQVIPWTTPGGAMVLLPQEAAIRAVLQEATGR